MPFFGGMALCTLGAVYQDINPKKFRDKILSIHKQALEFIEQPGGTMAGGTGWFDLGLCALSLGDVESAFEYFQKGLNIPTPQMLIMRPDYLIGLGLCSLQKGNVEEAKSYIDQARQYASEKQMANVIPLLEWAQGKILLAEGKNREAFEQFQKAEMIASTMHMRPLIRQARIGAVETLEKLGQNEESEKYRDLEKQITAEIVSLFQDPTLRQAYLENVELGETV
jgi:tetratricopeptide (TPR) repeat protein